MEHRLILFTDIGDTIIDEGTEVRNVPGGVVLRAECLPGARETMLSLYGQGYTIAMVADGLVASFHNTMSQNGLEHIFAAKAISEAVGAEKPDARMFQAAMDQLGLTEADKDRIVMIGNRTVRDVAGAKAFGIKSILLRWSPRYRDEWGAVQADYVIDRPEELPALLRRIEDGLAPKDGYRVVDRETYYRKGVFRHFSEDCKCSTSMTARVDVTELARRSRQTGTRFYINFLYILAKVLNSRDDYRMGYLWQTDELICYDRIHPTQYVFHDDTETCTPVYTRWREDYAAFYAAALDDVERAKQTREYALDAANHPNWFDASFIPWVSYDALNIELPDGYLYFAPIVNWGKYREENGRLMMPVSVRLNHAIADGYLIAKVFRLLEEEISAFCGR